VTQTDIRAPQADWDAVITGWRPTRSAAFLRSYSDAVNASLVRDWLPSGIRVLKTDLFDEAVGTGLYPLLRAGTGTTVGIDESAEVVAAAQARYPDLEAQQADVRRTGFPDGSFDAVLSNSTLDHFSSLDDIDAAFLELRRVLVPGGLLLITLDNAQNPLVALRNALPGRLLARLSLVPYPIGASCGHRRLARMLEAAGFAVEQRRAVMHFPRVLARTASVLPARSDPAALRAVLAFERFGSLPSRYLTAQFVAALARRL
jgi:SAM-dependent methyltransferase